MIKTESAMNAAPSTMPSNPALDNTCINALRFLSVDAVQQADSGHPGMPMGTAPLAYVLWTRFRLAVEAGASQGWHRYVGDHGDVLGVDRFGASAPGEIIMREYGFTVENVCRRVAALLNS
jgi:transketolase